MPTRRSRGSTKQLPITTPDSAKSLRKGSSTKSTPTHAGCPSCAKSASPPTSSPKSSSRCRRCRKKSDEVEAIDLNRHGGSVNRRHHPCGCRLSILYLEEARKRELAEVQLWLRRLLLQKRKLLRQPAKIFCRSKVPIILNFMSA